MVREAEAERAEFKWEGRLHRRMSPSPPPHANRVLLVPLLVLLSNPPSGGIVKG